ncbi:MAG TPA: class C sortase [Marmoricola sp.]|nr:class C sortase [Marmoricola sp.]
MVLIGTAGLSMLFYPQAGAWFSDRDHASTISGYVHTVTSMTPRQTASLLAAAHAYDKHLPTGPLQDPYSSSGGGRETVSGDDAEQYLHTLDVGQGGIIGVLAIARVGVSLPIYHGTGEQALEHGVGHLYGTSLPVGGPGTHAVLAGHSGIAGVTLFSNLHDVQLGDTFTVTVLNQTLTYQVDQIRTVLPDQTKDLRPVPGKDYVTLVTCTPIGINTHRLLVRGVRIPTPVEGAGPKFLHGGAGPGFPWWALEVAGCLGLLLVVTTTTDRKRAARRSIRGHQRGEGHRRGEKGSVPRERPPVPPNQVLIAGD